MAVSAVSIVVVGAGAAGLSTARRLYHAGFTNVIILEGSDRVGGRIKTVTPKEGDGIVELGATCIHGATVENPVFTLAQEWGLADSCTTIDRIAGQYYQEDGQVIDHSLVEQVWNLFREMEEKLNERVQSRRPQGSAQGSPMSCAQFVQEARSVIENKFPDWKTREEASRVLNSMLNYMRFMMGNELTLISADLAGRYKTLLGREAMFSGQGYNAFVENLQKSLPEGTILLNRQVAKIIWGRNAAGLGHTLSKRVKILCKNGEEYDADHVVVTCSLGHLKANYQRMFEPALPEAKAEAIRRMGFGQVTKLFVYYDRPFWKEGVKLAWSTDDYEITKKSDWVKRIVGFDEQPCNPHVLGGPFAGKGAEIVETLTDGEVATTCRDVLRKFLKDPSIPTPTKVLRSSWNTDPLYLGSYSYLSTDCHGHEIEDLSKPLPDDHHPVLIFAGEATHPCFYSTVHGAMLSGVREADRIIGLYKARM